MKGATFIAMGVALATLFLYVAAAAASDEAAQKVQQNRQDIELLSPDISREVVGKRPSFRWRFPGTTQEMLTVLDGVDVTALVSCREGECTFHPLQVLPAGDHTLQITWKDENGNEKNSAFHFRSRQTSILAEAYSSTDASVNYQVVLDKRDRPQIPYSKADSDITTQAHVKTTHWTFQAKSQLRYLDQNLPVTDPQKKGFDLVNFLVSSGYQKGAIQMTSEIGDIQVSETPTTVNGYARRGGQIFLNYKDVGLHAFSVQTQQVFGLDGGLGVGTDPFDHLSGVSGSLSLFHQHLKLHTLYAKGGERGSSFGLSTVAGGKKGEVAGFAMEANLLEQRLSLQGEFDTSKYDSDTSDEFGQESDKAYKIGATWNGALLGLDASYEYTGADYEVIGNQGLPKNREGFTVGGRLSAAVQSLEIHFARFHDNVEDDDLFPTVYNTEITATYTLSRWASLPISLSYQKAIQDSSDEPEYTPETDFHTDTVNLNLNWMKGALNLGLQGGYSYMNDKTGYTGDTSTYTLAFTPAYSGEKLQVTPMFSYNKSITHTTDVETNTYTANLDLQWQLTRRIKWSTAGNYNIVQADDHSVDQRTMSVDCRLSYQLMRSWRSLVEHPTVGIRGQYNWQKDKTYHSDSDSYAIMVDFTTNLKLSF